MNDIETLENPQLQHASEPPALQENPESKPAPDTESAEYRKDASSQESAEPKGVEQEKSPKPETPIDDASPRLDINFLSLDGHPIRKMMVQVRWEGGELLAPTDAGGRLPLVMAPAGAELSLAVQRFDGTYKAIGQCVMPSSEGYLTGISPNMVCDIKTEEHEGAPGDAEKRIPKAEPADLGDLGKPSETATAAVLPARSASEPTVAASSTPFPAQAASASKNGTNAEKKPSTTAKQKASKPPQNISGKESTKPVLQKGRDENGNPFAVITRKALDWWNSWRMPTFNLWGGEENKGKGTAPATPVTLTADMKTRVEALLAFAKNQTGYLYTQGTATILSEMTKGTFEHEAGEKSSKDSQEQCYIYVKVALTRCKIIDGILAADRLSGQSKDEHYAMQDSASKAGPALLAKGFTDVTSTVPDARWAAAGDIIVYEWSPETWERKKKQKKNPNYPNHGHIDIRDYETYISDHMPNAMHPGWPNYRNIRIYRKDYDPMPTLRIKAFLRCLREFECQKQHDDVRRYEMLHSPLPNTRALSFAGFATHPWGGVSDEERLTAVKEKKSTAAGAYQIVYGTWKGIFDQRLIELPNGSSRFTPDIQDRIAVMLIEEAKALHLVRVGKLEEAINKTDLKKTWPSLPGGEQNANRQVSGGKPMDMAYLKSLFETYLTEEKRNAGL